MFRSKYADVFHGDATWRDLDVPQGDLFDWDASVHLRPPARPTSTA